MGRPDQASGNMRSCGADTINMILPSNGPFQRIDGKVFAQISARKMCPRIQMKRVQEYNAAPSPHEVCRHPFPASSPSLSLYPEAHGYNEPSRLSALIRESTSAILHASPLLRISIAYAKRALRLQLNITFHFPKTKSCRCETLPQIVQHEVPSSPILRDGRCRSCRQTIV
jgi:hypothetical protein